MNALNTLLATYESHEQAESAIRELSRSGFDMSKLSIVGKGYHSEEFPIGFYSVRDRMKAWGGVGALIGSLWGMLFGAVFFWVPGIGLLGAVGPLVPVLIGALEGAAVLGGVSALGAALANIGVSKEAAIKYESSIRADKYLLIAHGNTNDIQQARDIIKHTAASDTAAFAA